MCPWKTSFEQERSLIKDLTPTVIAIVQIFGVEYIIEAVFLKSAHCLCRTEKQNFGSSVFQV